MKNEYRRYEWEEHFMTKSINKAYNGDIKISINKEEQWINPLHLVIGDKNVHDVMKEYKNEIQELKDTIANQNSTIKEMGKQFTECLNQCAIAKQEVSRLRKTLEETIREMITR